MANAIDEYLADYTSENENEMSDIENETVAQPRLTQSARKNKKNKIYNIVTTFHGEREVKIDSCWTKKRTYETADGIKQIFYCNKDKENCRMSAYLLFINTNEDIQFFVEEGEHVHKSSRKKDVYGSIFTFFCFLCCC
jgi:hypothetical protein